MAKTIKEIAEKKAEEYGEGYKQWCLANPGKIMNGLVSKQSAAREVAVGCDTEDELRAFIKIKRRVSEDFNERKLINGHKFWADAGEEILNEFLNQQ